MSVWWSWALAAVGIVGMWLAGHGNPAGWAVGLLAQALWLAYALATRQYGFVVTAVAYALVYWRNWRRHRSSSAIREGGDRE